VRPGCITLEDALNDQTDGAVSFSTLLTALEISGVDNLIEE